MNSKKSLIPENLVKSQIDQLVEHSLRHKLNDNASSRFNAQPKQSKSFRLG